MSQRNYKFDLDEWLPRFPLKPQHGRFSAEIITGPGQLCNNEHLRYELQDQFDWGESVPVDIFVMADGEPKDRWVTKIGGLPYRPADQPWPVADDGTPLTFLAQFNFSDSEDIIGALPGELLLVFGGSEESPADPIHFEWQDLAIANFMNANQIPDQSYSFSPCYGHIFRAESFPMARAKVDWDVDEYVYCRGLKVNSQFLLPQYQATQIGAAPHFVQREPELPGTLLCTISSVNPNLHGRHPWINRAGPLYPEDDFGFDEPKRLMIGDVGCIYISIDDDGNLHCSESSY